MQKSECGMQNGSARHRGVPRPARHPASLLRNAGCCAPGFLDGPGPSRARIRVHSTRRSGWSVRKETFRSLPRFQLDVQQVAKREAEGAGGRVVQQQSAGVAAEGGGDEDGPVLWRGPGAGGGRAAVGAEVAEDDREHLAADVESADPEEDGVDGDAVVLDAAEVPFEEVAGAEDDAAVTGRGAGGQLGGEGAEQDAGDLARGMARSLPRGRPTMTSASVTPRTSPATIDPLTVSTPGPADSCAASPLTNCTCSNVAARVGVGGLARGGEADERAVREPGDLLHPDRLPLLPVIR